MKYCPQCGQPGDDNQKFCMSCGADVSASPVSAAPYYPPQTKKKSDTKIALIILACVFAFMAIPFVLIVAAIAIPNLLRARISANEASAVTNTRMLVTASISYRVGYGHYPATLAQLGAPTTGAPDDENHAGLVDDALASGTKNGYHFLYFPKRSEDGNSFIGCEVHADPVSASTGTRHFYSSEDKIVRWGYNTANENSPPLGEPLRAQPASTDQEQDEQ